MLYVIDGPMKGESFKLNDDITTIGRASDNDIIVSDFTVSRHHAQFVKKDGKIFVVDLRSLHGVFVDNKKIGLGQEVEMEEDTTVRMGNTVLALQEKPPRKAEEQPSSGHAAEALFGKTGEILPEQFSLRNYTRSLELLLRVSNIFAQSLLDIDELLTEVIDQIFNLLERIDRGAILLVDKESGTLKELVSKTRLEDEQGLFSQTRYSRTIVNKTITEGKPVMMSDTTRVQEGDLSSSMRHMNIRSVMCVPLRYRGETEGAIYVDSIGLPEGFRKNDLQLLTALSNTAAIAIENAGLYADLETLVEKRTEQLEKAQESLKASESKFRAVFENMSNGLALLRAVGEGTDFVFEDFNKAAERIDRTKKEEVIGKSVLTVYPRFKEVGLFDILQRVWKTGKAEYHPPLLYEDERITSWRTNYVYKVPSGEIVVLYEDVTAEKQALENQGRLQKQLSHAQKMESVGRLAGGVAHNFRNILQAIMGNSQFLQMAYAQDEQLKKVTRVINESVRKGSDFIDSLLKFSRQDIERAMVPLDLGDVLNETHKIISNTFDKRIRIVTKIDESLPIKGDYLSLNQVFINLCNNARDAMADGGMLKIEAKKNKTEVRVMVSDNGAGIDEGALKNIFDPFFTTKDVGEGTGLGLSITHGIVEEHNGTISVKSKPGKGTVFTVSFPIGDSFDRVESESPLNIRHGNGEKILIVDDEPDVLKSLENLVRSIGYDVALASSGSQALEQYKKGKPEVVLLDWKMPTMDGAACATRIFENDPAARIVIISGYQETDVDVIDPTLKKNIKDFVTKPCDLKQLSKVIVSALSS